MTRRRGLCALPRPRARLLWLLALGAGASLIYLQCTGSHLSAVDSTAELEARAAEVDSGGVQDHQPVIHHGHHHHHQQLLQQQQQYHHYQQQQQQQLLHHQQRDFQKQRKQQEQIQQQQQQHQHQQRHQQQQQDTQDQRPQQQQQHHDQQYPHHQQQHQLQQYNHPEQETQEERLALLHEACSRFSLKPNVALARPPSSSSSYIFHLPPRSVASRIFVSDRLSLLYCEVPKAGCTNWKRLLMVLEGRHPGPPEVISREEAHSSGALVRLDSLEPSEQRWRLQNYTNVLFVREPMERLVSAFRDKLQRPNPYYQSTVGRSIISRYRRNASAESLRTGRDVTFGEFARFLLDPLRPPGSDDPHWEAAHRLCLPCALPYGFVGKLESSPQDSDVLLRRAGAPRGLAYPQAARGRGGGRGRESSVSLAVQYLSRLSAATRRALYAAYYRDYALFGYPRPAAVR
ncbi:carbohydrate sulfotransferase 8-like [Lethenteron reissneri]|uniref:carbohydrate sulfotransferase 8-like n=1 Tax=Lethenteron reissneri TaxID=7753 RepID=UPI002AB78EE7|nr:carbohydrate sulfotransferase 8-like [Lethenteron reissneri]